MIRNENGTVDLIDSGLSSLSIDAYPLNGFYFPINTLEKINLLRDEGYALNTFRDLRELAEKARACDLDIDRNRRRLLIELGVLITESLSIKIERHKETIAAIARLRIDNVDLHKDDRKVMDKLEKCHIPFATAEDIFSIDEFAFVRTPSIRARYCELLRNLKKKLLTMKEYPAISNEDKATRRNVEEIKNFMFDWRNLRSTDIKVINKLKSLHIPHTTVGDLFAVDEKNFISKPGVGAVYREYLGDLKQRILTDTGLTIDPNDTNLNQYSAFMRRKVIVNRLSKGMQKTLNKLKRYGLSVHSVEDLFNVDEAYLTGEKGVGEKSIMCLRELKGQILKDPSLSREANLEISFSTIEEDIRNITKQIERMVDKGRQKIISSRLRLFCRQITFLELANELGLTESRVSQIFTSFVKDAQNNLSHPIEICRRFLNGESGQDFKAKLQGVYSYFNSDDFFNFLEILFGFESNELLKAQTCTQKEIKDSLAKVFSNYSFPLPVTRFMKILIQELEHTEVKSKYLLKKAQEASMIHIEDDCIDWALIHPKAAVANVLLSEPRGLHWEDIVRLVNKQMITKEPLTIDYNNSRRHLRANNSIVKIEFGAYRHRRYHSCDEELILSLAESVEDHLNNMRESEVPLKKLYEELNPDNGISYFEFRQTVQEFFPDHFNGVSRRDLLLKKACASPMFMRDKILDAVSASDGSITVDELYERQIGTYGGIFMCLHQLKKDGHVVRVGAKTYTTKEKLYQHLDIKAIKRLISDLLSSTERIIEADLFRVLGNQKMKESYRKEVYTIVGEDLCREGSFYCVKSMFSKKPIPANSMYDLFKKIYRPGMCKEELLAASEEHIVLSEEYKNHSVPLIFYQLTKKTNRNCVN